MFDNIITRALLLTSLLLVSGVSLADSFDDAVNEYLRGFKECTEANTLRTTDLASAKKKFDDYLKALNNAASIDSKILNTTQRDMDKNLRYCERVQQDIKRAEATPILEKGFTYCDKAKDSLESGNIDDAQTNLAEYKRYRDDAFIVTESVMDVFALASKVRACSRVEEKIAEATRKESAVATAMKKAASDYESFLKGCAATKSTITSPKFTLKDLDAVNQEFSKALKFKKAARENGDAFATMSAQPEREDSQALKKLVNSAATCEGEVSNYIRTATKNKRNFERDIEDGTKQLQRSLASCQAAQKLSGHFESDADAGKAEAQYNDSASLKRKVVNDSKLIGTVKLYPEWRASQNFARLMNETESCQTNTANAIKAQKAALVSREQKAQAQAARQAQLDAQKKAQAEAQAAEQAKLEAQKKAQAEHARKEAAKAAKLDDVTPAKSTKKGDDEFGSFGDQPGSDDKSWTNLIK